MNLAEYFDSQSAMPVAALRKAIGVKSDAQVRQWRYGYARRVPSPPYCIAIERATGGMVTRADLRPHDWQQIWPEYTPPSTGTTQAQQPQLLAPPKPFKPRVRANARKAAKHHPKEAQA